MVTEIKTKAPFDPKRAARGTSMIHTTHRYENKINTLGDVLLDLMHNASQSGVSFQLELLWAANEFEKETQ